MLKKDEILHFILSIIAGVTIGYFCGNWWAIPVALVSGFFIDADHLIDYCIYTKLRRFNLAEFTAAEYFDHMGKVYIFAHGYEFVIIAAILGKVFPTYGWLFFALALSHIFHLLYDTISNKPIWPTYFLIYRIAKNFDHSAFDFKCQK